MKSFDFGAMQKTMDYKDMKSIFSKICLFLIVFPVFSIISVAQEKFDIISFKTPAGWQKEVKSNAVQFGKEDASKGTVYLMILFKSVPAGNNSKDNFSKFWDAIFKDVLTEAKAGEPQLQPTATENGWNIESGMAQYENEGAKGIAMLVSATGGGKVVNLFILTNSDAFQAEIMSFIESIVLPKAEQNNPPQTIQTNTVSQNPKQSGYKYNKTPFDDGWTAVEEEDWVRVSKGNITVFLHYPKQGTIFPADPDVLTNAAWNILVAPHYSNLKNYKTVSPSQDWERPYLASGYVTDKQTNKQVFAVLFRKSNGWFEVATPDKNTFVQEFNFDPEQVVWNTDTAIFNKLASMPNYNRFAVAASDFSGTWISNSSAIQQMYFANTGNYAGMNMNQSSQEFIFSNNSYNWKIVSVNGMAGNSVASQAKSSGTFTVLNDWQVRFSDIEGKPKKYNAYFSCIKGARLLHVNDTDAPGSGIYTVFARTK